MSKIFVGNITASAERLLNKYIDKFMPDIIVEPLKESGIRGKIKNHARRPEVLLVILDEAAYNMCKGVADNVLSLPKVHKYVSDEGLKKFLEEKFGVLDDTPVAEVNDIEPLHADTSVSVETKQQDITEVIDDEFDSLTITDSEDTSNDFDKDSIIQKLNDELIIRDTMIRNLEAQMEEKSANNNIAHFVARIKSLESELESTKDELSKLQNDSYADLGKVTRAEQIIKSLDELKENLRTEKDKCLSLESEKSELESKIKKKNEELQKVNQTVEELISRSKDCDNLKSKVSELTDSITSLQSDYDLKVNELNDLTLANEDLEHKIVELNSQVAELGVLNEKVDSLTEENKQLLSKTSDLASIST